MLPFLPQERPESCVPACLRVILASVDVILSEAEVYAGCETDVDGTLPSKAAEFATALGYPATALRLTDINELYRLISTRYLYPIIFVNLTPLLGINVIHAVVIETVDSETATVTVVDPAFPPTGQRNWSLPLFEIGWQMARRQTILVDIM